MPAGNNLRGRQFRLMRYPILILLVLAAMFSLAAVVAIQVGMPEAKLLQLKGSPVSKAALGNKIICRWSDMEVTLAGGKVERVQYRDPKLEKTNAAHSAAIVSQKKKEAEALAAANKKKAAMAPDGPPADYVVQVSYLSEGGAVVEILKPEYTVVASSSQSIGGGGGAYSSLSYQPSGKMIYVTDLSGCVDGDRFKINATSAGTYSIGHQTMRRYILNQAAKL